jgi:hypothetical protein
VRSVRPEHRTEEEEEIKERGKEDQRKVLEAHSKSEQFLSKFHFYFHILHSSTPPLRGKT